MDRLDLGPVVAMRAPAFSYVRIDAHGFFTAQQLAQLLVDQRLGHFVATSGKRSAVLNASAAQRIGTEDFDFFAEHWAPLLASIEVRRVSIVVPEQVFSLFGQVFAHGAARAARHGVEIRCFPSAQFTNTWESVTWLDAPAAGAAVGAAPKPLMEMPKLVDSRVWTRANVLGIAFLTPQGAPPGLGFIFQDPSAANEIFDAWRRDLGPRDEAEMLRVSIIEGERPGKPPGYIVTLMPNIEAIAKRAAETGGLSFDINTFDAWAKSMNTPPGGSPHLATWKQLYAERGEYAIVPVFITGASPDPQYDKQLVKRQVFLRSVRDVVGPNDPDAFVMK